MPSRLKICLAAATAAVCLTWSASLVTAHASGLQVRGGVLQTFFHPVAPDRLDVGSELAEPAEGQP